MKAAMKIIYWLLALSVLVCLCFIADEINFRPGYLIFQFQ